MKNLPNRLYLANLEVTAKDVYMKHDFANKTVEKIGTREPDKMRETISNTNIDTRTLDFLSINSSQSGND